MNEIRNDLGNTHAAQRCMDALSEAHDAQMLPEPQTHYLKTWPIYFEAVRRGDKRFEIRRDNRGFQKGDVVVLCRTCEGFETVVECDERGAPLHTLRFRIGWILTGGQFGLEPGFVAMQLVEA